MKKILILSLSTGGGHNEAAKNILEKINFENEKAKEKVEVVKIDALKDFGNFGKKLDVLVSGGYEKSAKYIPKVYGKAYSISDKEFLKKGIDRNFIISYMENQILGLYKEKDYNVIISTHPFSSLAASNLIRKGKISNTKLVSIITDYTIHVAHIGKMIDYYVVPSEDTKTMLKFHNVSDEKIKVFGIPTREVENTNILTQIEELKKEKGIEDKKTILVAGGSFGAGNIKTVLQDIENIKESVNLVVICARNEKLKKSLEKGYFTKDGVEEKSIFKKKKNSKHNVIIEGFTTKMPHYYKIADLIVTKPGGLTITECMKYKVPMVIPFFVPGQEEGNKDFIIENQLGLVKTKYYKIPMLIDSLMEDRNKVNLIKESLGKNYIEGSLDKIYKLVMEI